ncbi:MAG: DUF3810 domain-containing protein [Flavisolibacter sp.]|jgi:hypothetical protein|nr:DUF3810 domain-containing protein [Flavisolibacter sp.]
MLRSLLRDRYLIFLFVLALLIRLFSSNETWVEAYYTYGFYPHISKFLRLIFGWIPFSLGDLLYILAFIFLVWKTWKFLRLLARRKVKEYLSWILFGKYLKLVLWIYIVFNVFWGLNYNRQGIAHQLNIEIEPYAAEDVFQLASVLSAKVNLYASSVDTAHRKLLDRNNKVLFDLGVQTFEEVKKTFPYLEYRFPSVKPSLFTPVGHFFGFTGYYNPFSAEAQLKTTVPVFVKPFILCHEIAHQLGYGKENEANMVAFLAGRASPDNEFRYSAYYDVFLYTLHELGKLDKQKFLMIREGMHPRFNRDYRAYLQYLLKNRNIVEPWISEFYDGYLKMNSQPKGKQTYNEVVAWLIAYMKKHGAENI